MGKKALHHVAVHAFWRAVCLGNPQLFIQFRLVQRQIAAHFQQHVLLGILRLFFVTTRHISDAAQFFVEGVEFVFGGIRPRVGVELRYDLQI